MNMRVVCGTSTEYDTVDTDKRDRLSCLGTLAYMYRRYLSRRQAFLSIRPANDENGHADNCFVNMVPSELRNEAT